MSHRERLGWTLVCIIPRFLASWLMMGSGQKVPLPTKWYPYLFGRALGVDGRRSPVAPAALPPAA